MTLPDGVDVVVSERPDRDAPAVEFWVPPFLRPAPDGRALAGLTGLRVVQLLTAGADAWVGRVPGRRHALRRPRRAHAGHLGVGGHRDPVLPARLPALRPGPGARRVGLHRSPTNWPASGC